MKQMSFRELLECLQQLDQAHLDRPAIVRVQDDDGSTMVGGLFSASLEVPCGSDDDLPELVLDGSYDADELMP